MILSFGITTKLSAEKGVLDPLTTGLKTVSRRVWTSRTSNSWIKAYREGKHLHQAWSADPYVAGAKQLGTFRLICEPYQERLRDMPEEDVLKEGGFWQTKKDYINDLASGDADKIVWVVRWTDFQIVGK